jgi:hypothetical protein
MHGIEGVVITFVLLLNWVDIYLYLVIANKILTNFKSNAQLQLSSLVSLTLHVSSHFWRVHAHYCNTVDDTIYRIKFKVGDKIENLLDITLIVLYSFTNVCGYDIRVTQTSLKLTRFIEYISNIYIFE